jgi:hypothetical protein
VAAKNVRVLVQVAVLCCPSVQAWAVAFGRIAMRLAGNQIDAAGAAKTLAGTKALVCAAPPSLVLAVRKRAVGTDRGSGAHSKAKSKPERRSRVWCCSRRQAKPFRTLQSEA